MKRLERANNDIKKHVEKIMREIAAISSDTHKIRSGLSRLLHRPVRPISTNKTI